MHRKYYPYDTVTSIYVTDMNYADIITPTPPFTLGEQLRYKRVQLDLKQRELANELGVSRDTIMRIENDGEVSIGVKVDIIKKLSLYPGDDYTAFLCNSFGEYIMKERIRLGMTQQELANILKVSRKTVRFWEKEYSYPLYENYVSLIKILHQQP